MRPLELRLAHFGPYRDKVVLDFEALDRLFLVCGPTGAGKTTLFDALTYALYERTPGTRGGLTDQLASHHAPEGVVPEVSLRFSLGPQQWRVTRQLRHRVPKKKGEGWTERDAQVLLERLEDGTWKAIPGKRSEINLTLEDLLGLSAEEFSKIVVLPQGDFQRFLEASSGEREKMLQKLFPVETYDRLVDNLKARAKTVEEERRRWEDRWQDLMARRGGTAELSELEEGAAEAEARAQLAARLEAEAAAELVRLKASAADWRVLEAKRQDAASLNTRRPQVDAQRTRLERARRARPWGADLDRQDQILSEGRSLRTQQDLCREEAAGVATALAAYQGQASEREAREVQWGQLLAEKGRLEHLKSLWSEDKTLAAREAETLAAERTAEAAHLRAQDARVRAEGSLSPAPTGPGWDEALATLETARRADQAARADAEAQAAGEALSRDLEAARSEESALTAASAVADREAALWTQVVDAVKAAVLAGQLSDGQPCPVCGSTHHPHPAAWPDASAEAPVRLEAALKAQAEAHQARAVVQARCADLSARREALPARTPAVSVPEAAAALAQAQQAVDALRRWAAESEAARGSLEVAVSAETRARGQWQAAVRARETWTTRRESLAEAVTADPTARLEALSREESDLRRRLEQDRRTLETLTVRQSELAARINEQEKQLVAQRDEYARLKAGLEGAAAPLGWSLDELKAARLPENELRGLEEAVAAFDREDHRLAGETAALEAQFPNGPPAPWEPAEQALEERKLDRAAADAAAREKAFALRDRERIELELREVATARQALEADFQRLVPLAQALDGRNRLNLKLTTWVLVQALEQVTASATHRLAAMSGGRYALKVQSQGLDGRKDWGLDLAVVDGFTGQERGVGTLSGGEKFMTSISLALGLADVIQERAGGLKLEAIFIDEGFGTLDDQSLDRAMAILLDLGKNRSVGLISHVAELRQRISSRVEVIKGKNGSTLRVG